MKNIADRAHLKRSLLWALVFQLSWLGLAALTFAVGGSVKMVLLIGLLPLLWVPALLQLITHTRLPIGIHICYYVLITLSSVLGSSFAWYTYLPHWDALAHAYSGVFLAWVGMYTIKHLEEKLYVRIPGWVAIAAALLTPLAFAAMWEIGEFTSDFFVHTATQAGLADTITDMLSAGVGGFLATLLAVWFRIPRGFLPRALKTPIEK